MGKAATYDFLMKLLHVSGITMVVSLKPQEAQAQALLIAIKKVSTLRLHKVIFERLQTFGGLHRN